MPKTTPDREWIVGRGWNDESFVPKALPTKEDLDQVSRHRPVVFIRVCGHACAVNSKALELAGISAFTPDPPGGSIDRENSGEPTGILRENAIDLVTRLLPEPTVAVLKEVISKAARAAAALGLTTVQANDLDGADTLSLRLDAYRGLAAAGELPIRVILQAAMPTPDDLAVYLDLRQSCPDLGSHLALGPLKLYADGSLGAGTAALGAPYADAPESSGMPIYTQAELDELVLLAAIANLQIAVHAIGDRALEMVLTSYERAKQSIPDWNARPRVVHCQIATRKQLAKMELLWASSPTSSPFSFPPTCILQMSASARTGRSTPMPGKQWPRWESAPRAALIAQWKAAILSGEFTPPSPVKTAKAILPAAGAQRNASLPWKPWPSSLPAPPTQRKKKLSKAAFRRGNWRISLCFPKTQPNPHRKSCWICR